jgi:hypothetical protein
MRASSTVMDAYRAFSGVVRFRTRPENSTTFCTTTAVHVHAAGGPGGGDGGGGEGGGTGGGPGGGPGGGGLGGGGVGGGGDGGGG